MVLIVKYQLLPEKNKTIIADFILIMMNILFCIILLQCDLCELIKHETIIDYYKFQTF